MADTCFVDFLNTYYEFDLEGLERIVLIYNWVMKEIKVNNLTYNKNYHLAQPNSPLTPTRPSYQPGAHLSVSDQIYKNEQSEDLKNSTNGSSKPPNLKSSSGSRTIYNDYEQKKKVPTFLEQKNGLKGSLYFG